MANALKKITAAAKAIRKKSPGTSWKTAVKKAGAMYRGGKLKTKRRKVSGAKVGAVKKTRKRAKRRVSARKVTRVVSIKVAPVKRRRRRSAPKKVTRRRARVSGGGKDRLIQTLAIAGLGIGLLVAFTRQRQQTYPMYTNTGNNYRDSRAQQILQIAQQAALSATQIYNLINRINTSSDAQLDQMYQSANSGGISMYA
jgi:hypothetical protein